MLCVPGSECCDGARRWGQQPDPGDCLHPGDAAAVRGSHVLPNKSSDTKWQPSQQWRSGKSFHSASIITRGRLLQCAVWTHVRRTVLYCARVCCYCAQQKYYTSTQHVRVRDGSIRRSLARTRRTGTRREGCPPRDLQCQGHSISY